jgi:integrase
LLSAFSIADIEVIFYCFHPGLPWDLQASLAALPLSEQGKMRPSLTPSSVKTGSVLESRGIVSPEANTGNPLKGSFERMARKRYQRGQLFQKGKKQKVWIARWREDVIRPDGTRRRVRKSEVLGTLKQYATRRLAERALEGRLAEAEINSLNYQPRPTASFCEFVTKWQKDVLSQLKPSTRSADKSRILKHLIPEFGDVCMKDLTAQRIQGMIARKAGLISPKSLRNLIALLGMMWNQAKAWGYVQHDPFPGLVLPERDPLNERCLTLEEMRALIVAANEPYKTYYWILAETGVRAGEIGALPATNLLLDQGAIRIAQSVWHGKIQTVKSKKGNRVCEISPLLVERGYIRTWRPNRLGLLFATRNGTPWDTDTVRKRKLYPLLQKLGIERCGFHAFRHGNATAMDQEQVPIATRQNRLGQSDARTTMGYTHAMSQDGRIFAARFGQMLTAGNA